MHLVGLRHPGVDVGGLRGRQHDRRGQRHGHAARAADQLVEHHLLDLQVVLGGDLLGNHEVVAGLGLARVGDGGSADLEVALGRGQLLGHGHLLRAHQGQAVLAGEHVEVGLAHAHDEVLLGDGEHRLRHFGLALALLVGGPVGGAVQRLRGVDAHVLRGEVARGAAAAAGAGQGVDVQVAAVHARGEPDGRQDAGLGLRGARQVGLVLGPRALVGGVEAARGIVEFVQCLALGRQCEQARNGACEGCGKRQKPGPGRH
ncbi:hypothetical protein D3C85_195720 [compost metagenome]